MRLLRLIVITVIAAPAFGLTGRVFDSTGAAIPGVTVEAMDAGRAFIALTERSGRYSLDLPPGTHATRTAKDSSPARRSTTRG